jgi:hypothetical protein
LVAFCSASRSAGDSLVIVTPSASIAFSVESSCGVMPLRAAAMFSLPAWIAAWRTISRSAGVQLFHTSLLATKISGSAT